MVAVMVKTPLVLEEITKFRIFYCLFQQDNVEPPSAGISTAPSSMSNHNKGDSEVLSS